MKKRGWDILHILLSLDLGLHTNIWAILYLKTKNLA